MKTMNSNEKEQLMADSAETMCMLEKEMPPSFFNIMSHMPNHLVEELFLCGPFIHNGCILTNVISRH